MSRYLAFGEIPKTSESDFRDQLDAVKKWRIDRQSWVIKAYCSLEGGRVVIECETPERARFEAWLKNTGWQIDSIHDVDLIYEANTIWKL